MGLNDNVQSIVTKLTTLDTSLNNVSLPHKVPSTATAMHSSNTAAITTTTGLQVKAAVASKKLYITSIDAVNFTTTEDQTIQVYEGTATTITTIIATLQAQDVDTLTSVPQRVFFNPPLQTAAGTAVFAKGLIATKGDTWVTINGYQQA